MMKCVITSYIPSSIFIADQKLNNEHSESVSNLINIVILRNIATLKCHLLPPSCRDRANPDIVLIIRTIIHARDTESSAAEFTLSNNKYNG